MLSENIKTIRKAKGLSQEELAVKVNVVRQTISKWEQGLSVPDSDLLIALSEALETPVSTLLGESIEKEENAELKTISEKLEVINLQLAKRNISRRKTFHYLFIAASLLIVILFAVLALTDNFYLYWDFSDPETAVAGTIIHGLAWVFVRIAPFALIGTIVGIIMTGRKDG